MAETRTPTMTQKPRPWGAVALGVIFIALGCWVAVHLEWQEETARSGFSDEARHNPYHAGMLLLTQSGYPAERVDDATVLNELSAHSTLLLDSPELFNNRSQIDKLLGWVQRGGHLVLPLSRYRDPDALLKALGIQTLGWNDYSLKRQSINIEGATLFADLRDAVIFDLGPAAEWSAKLPGYFSALKDDERDDEAIPQRPFHTQPTTKGQSENHAVYARWKLGRGYVTAGDLSPFRNTSIDEADHASLFVRLMTLPGDTRPAYIALTAKYPGLGTWLVQHASEALLALAVLLAALLWRAMPRFGPQLPDIAPKRPGLLDHLSAVGDFLLRQKQYEALIAPLREDVVIRLTHLRGRHPEMASLPELGAHITKLDVREVTLALTPEPGDAHEFQRRSRTLATLRDYCNSIQNKFSPEGS